MYLEGNNRKKPISYIFLFLSLTFISISNAQEPDSVKDKSEQFSFQYQIQQDIKVSSFVGNFFAIKYIGQNNVAYRMGFIFFYSDINANSATTINNEYHKFTSDYRDYELGLTFDILYNIKISYDMNLYFGLGPFWRRAYHDYSRFEYDRYRDPSVIPDETADDRSYLGINLIVGAEYFILARLSLIAESSIAPTYLKGHGNV